MSGQIDPRNSTETPLGAGASFTGRARAISKMAAIRVTCEADVDGSLFIETSPDQANWRPKEMKLSATKNLYREASFSAAGGHYRLRYENGATPQSFFRLQSTIHPSASSLAPVLIDEATSGASMAVPTRVDSDHFLDISRRLHPDRSVDFISGVNPNADQNNFVGVWIANTAFNWPIAAETLVAQSTSDEDAPGGDGAASVTVNLLDGQFDPAVATIPMNGMLESNPTATAAIRVNVTDVGGCGLYTNGGVLGNNVGTITIRQSSSGALLDQIAPGRGKAQSAKYTAKSGSSAYISGAFAEVDSTQSASVRLWVRPRADIVVAPFSPALIAHEVESLSTALISGGQLFARVDALADIWVDTKSGGGGAAFVAARFAIVLIEDL